MRPRLAIVGSGVTAGLAATLLARANDVTVFQPDEFSASPIPEIVPRRAFFKNACLGSEAEKRILAEAATSVSWVVWHRGMRGQKHRLSSNQTYFVYDKGRLARALLNNASALDVRVQDVPQIGAITGFHTVLDCRGARAAQADPVYETERRCDARTHCTYVIADRPDTLSSDTMEFWSKTTRSGRLRTYYVIPVGPGLVSLGCSSDPADAIDHPGLLVEACEVGIALDEITIRMSGTADPHPTITRNKLSHVLPLGDACGLPCPLTEYGTLKALSQIAEISGGKRLPPDILRRSVGHEIDPHMPMELFI